MRRPWTADDPDANVNADVALHARVDPLATVRSLGFALELPVGAAATAQSRNETPSVNGGLIARR